MMDHDDRPPEQVEAIHAAEEVDIDQEEIIASKVLVGKNSATVRATKLVARLLSQRFGGIPGVPVGAKWESRQDCSSAGVHRPFMAGIHGNKQTGAFSIVVSCYYKDDKDFGDTIYYTGTGGRKRWSDDRPPKRLRLGPQVFDQQWSDPGNEALVKSRDTGNPVRVIRSHKVLSDFAPAEGYQYDGLYTVECAWKEKNPKGLDICRYRLERVPGQPPLLRRSLGDNDHEPSPASVATSDTVLSPPRSRKHKARPFAPQGDPTIYADPASKKRKLADQASPLPLSFSSSSIVQPQVSAPVLVTIETPLQRHNRQVQKEMQKEMQKEKEQRFLGTSSPVKTPAKGQPLRTLIKPSISSQSQPNGLPARPMRSIFHDEDDEDADMLLDDEDEEDIPLEDPEITASPFSSLLSPSHF